MKIQMLAIVTRLWPRAVSRNVTTAGEPARAGGLPDVRRPRPCPRSRPRARPPRSRPHRLGRGQLDLSRARRLHRSAARRPAPRGHRASAAIASRSPGRSNSETARQVYDREWNWLRRPATDLQTFEYSPAYQAFCVSARRRARPGAQRRQRPIPGTGGASRCGSKAGCSAGSGSGFRRASSTRSRSSGASSSVTGNTTLPRPER